MKNIFFGKRDREKNPRQNYWAFRKIAAIEEMQFNNALEGFYNLGIRGLVRENIQNSLDGKLQGCDQPVQVIIKTGEMSPDHIPGIEEVKVHIQSLYGGNEYANNTIKHMKECMDKTTVPYISFEDRNTKGLKGAEHGEDTQPGDTWGIYAYKKGSHFVESDSAIESRRGGSHGIGKIASNAASDLHMMYFANCDEYGKQHIGGTVELIEHELNGEKYRATGYFTKEIGDKYMPFKNNFDPVFEKKTRGLKIIIPYLREQFRGNNAIINTVCDNFFIAILDKSLEVFVDDILINSDTIMDIVKDPEIFPEQEYNDIKNNFTPLYVKTYLEQEPLDLIIKDKKREEYLFSLYFTYDENIKKGRVAIVRGIGMKIEDKKISGYVNASFNAVMIPKTTKEDVFLKTLENEAHTSISAENIRNPEMQKNAKRFINNIDKEIKAIIADYIAKANPSDGKIDTSDLIFSVERNFKKELSKHIEAVEINKDRKNGKKKIVKIRKKKDEEKKEVRQKTGKHRKPRINTETNKERYPMRTEAVKRIVINNTEKIAFDFSGEDQYEGETECDIALVVVDGMGHLEESLFNINDNYTSIYDKKKNAKCSVSGNMIKNVKIEDGKAVLEMKVSEHFNKSLKFIYYVEV